MLAKAARLFRSGLKIVNDDDRPSLEFPGTARYWEERYRRNGSSGMGSYGPFARMKADFINDYINRHGVQSVVDFGAGDGNQLRLLKIPRYVGLDVSETAITRLQSQFSTDQTKRFVQCNGVPVGGDVSLHADLGLSMDVIYHLIEDDVYERYIRDLFRCAQRHVIIYSSDREQPRHISRHVRHRNFTAFVQNHLPGWKLAEVHKNPFRFLSYSSFFIFRPDR